jgi:hypothetical protein
MPVAKDFTRTIIIFELLNKGLITYYHVMKKLDSLPAFSNRALNPRK